MSQQWNPLQDLMVLQDRMNRLFEDATQRRNQADAGAGDEFERADWTPASDIYETESGYLIAIDLPGIDRQALEIDIDDGRLVVKGVRPVAESRQHRSERPRGQRRVAVVVHGRASHSQRPDRLRARRRLRRARRRLRAVLFRPRSQGAERRAAVDEAAVRRHGLTTIRPARRYLMWRPPSTRTLSG